MDSAGSCGIDGGKKVNGRKLFIMTDTLGLVVRAINLLQILKYPRFDLQNA
ncbi:MAG: hypothetical protein WCO45_16165 [Pseudanabaena sp. ELA607]